MPSRNFPSKRKILNDPIYGFISISHELIFDIIQHPYFQRLRRVTQLGLTNLVYPGANHTRFQHALGAMHLMERAIETLRNKGHEINEEEALGATIAILLHDIGHGPYSHTLERSIVEGVHHEVLSVALMEKLNQEFDGKLSLALSIFNGSYHKKFLHQLVSSQLDMDRLDYLKRDSFFTGVSEGVVGSDRIIKMLEVVNDELAIEAKGIYSIEKFIVARRLMYWQVYLHKTVLAAEFLLMKVLLRAKELARKGVPVFASPNLTLFLTNAYNKEEFLQNNDVFTAFTRLDDYDILTAIKVWCDHEDKILKHLSRSLVNRKLYKIQMQKKPFSPQEIKHYEDLAKERLGISEEDMQYVVFSGEISNHAYDLKEDKINILYKDGTVVDIAEAADLLNISVMTEPVKKWYLCFPKSLF